MGYCTFFAPPNPSETHLIVSSSLGEAAQGYLRRERNRQLRTRNESSNDELRKDVIEDIDLDVKRLSWLYRAEVKARTCNLHLLKKVPKT